MKVYVAGALFNEAEVAQRKKEGKILREAFPNFEIFNPIDQPFNEHKQTLPTPMDIFTADANAVRECDIFIADVTNEDSGVMVELGIAIETKTKIVIGINSDIRLGSANQYDIPPYSMNHFVLGAIQSYGHLTHSFAEAVEKLKQLI